MDANEPEMRLFPRSVFASRVAFFDATKTPSAPRARQPFDNFM